MNSAKRFRPALATLVAALLIFTNIAAAQRRRSRTQPRTNVPSTQAPKPAAKSQPAQAQEKKEAPKEDAEASAGIDQTFAETVAADGYAVCLEIRKVGRLLRSKEVGELLGLLREMGGEAKEVLDLLSFYTSHGERLDDVSAYTVLLPTRPGLPQFIGAYEFPDVESAKAMEPLIRGEMAKYDKQLIEEKGGAPGKKSSPSSNTRPGKQSKTKGAPAPPEQKLVLKRYGRLILTSTEPFMLKSLKGEGLPSLADNTRFQSLRSRLSSEPLFLYLDVELLSKSTERMRAELEQQAHGAEEEARLDEVQREIDLHVNAGEGVMGTLPAETITVTESLPTEDGFEPPPPPVGMVDETEEEVLDETVPSMSSGQLLMGMIFSAMPFAATKWPEAVGASLALEGEAFVIRAVVINPASDLVQPVPFLPVVVSGPLITPQAAGVVPSDTEVLITASLDLTQIFNSMIASASEAQKYNERERAKIGAKEEVEQPGPDDSLKAAEQLLGFKIRDDFLPALGNELAVSLPLEWFTGGTGYNAGYSPNSKTSKDGAGKSGVVFVSLNNAEEVKKMLPRVLGLLSPQSLVAKAETINHNGVEIQVYGDIAVAYINNFLALSFDVPSIKRVIDSNSSLGTLLADEHFRSASSWQPRQKLAEGYVSRALIENLLGEFTHWTDPKDTEVQQLLARLQIQPEAISYSLTNEGGDLTHELRLPTALVKYFAAAAVLEKKMNPLRQSEGMTLQALDQIRIAQEVFKKTKGKGSYATLEELRAQNEKQTPREEERIREYLMLENLGYDLKLSAAGDRYTVTATPKEYGKTGRRSFFMDESGVIRAAERNGEPANANDPPID